MTAPLDIVVSDPDWLPHAFDASGNMLTFVHVPRQARAEVTFLSDEHYKGQYPKQSFAIGDVAAALGDADSASPHFIFHSSFCCSTLLAKALDVPGRTLALREPDVLLHLANRFVANGEASEMERLRLTLRLLGRPYSATETVIVKPSNLANRLIGPALAHDAGIRAVFLYSDLRALLRSLANKGLWGRIFGRQLYRNLAAWTKLRTGFGPVETFDQTDLQIAALAWLMHIHQFNDVASQYGPERVMLLKSSDLLADKPGCLGRVAGFFNLGLDDATVGKIAAGPVFAEHSKSREGFTAGDRQRDHSDAEATHGEEIGMVVKWTAAVAEHAGVPLQPTLLG